MKVADVVVTLGVGLCITGVAISVIQFLLAWGNRRATRRVAQPFESVSDPFLDWLTTFVLGPKRLDHEPMYSCTISAIFLVGAFWVLVGPLPQSVIFTFSDVTQVTLSACLWMSSGTCLYGIAMGTPFDMWRAIVRVYRRKRRYPPQPPLDVRRAYRVGTSGVPAAIVGLSYYTASLITSTPLGWTGANAIFLSFICLGLNFQLLRFLMEVRKINKNFSFLVKQEAIRRELSVDLLDDGNPMETKPKHRKWRWT